MPHRRLLPALVCLPLLTLPAAAGAATSTWQLELDVKGSLKEHYDSDNAEPGGTRTRDWVDVSWHTYTLFGGLTVRDGRIVAIGSGLSSTEATGTFTRVNTSPDYGTRTIECGGETGEGHVGEPQLLGGDPEAETPSLPTEVLTIRPFERIRFSIPCRSGTWQETEIDTGNAAGWEDGDGPWDVIAAIPPEAWAAGKIVQVVKPDPVSLFGMCGVGAQVSCTPAWEGTLTLTRTQYVTEPPLAPPGAGPLAPPLAPPYIPPGTPPATPPAAPSAAKAKLSRDGASATFQASCPGGCSGTFTATALGARASQAAAAAPGRRKPLATGRFTVGARGTKAVTVRFGKRARAAIRRAGGVRIAVTLTPRAKGARPASRTLVARR